MLKKVSGALIREIRIYLVSVLLQRNPLTQSGNAVIGLDSASMSASLAKSEDVLAGTVTESAKYKRFVDIGV